MKKSIRIGVVGACGTGKSELVTRLIQQGYDAHHIAQEHSFNPKMWQLITNPEILIYLQASYQVILQRKAFQFSWREYKEQLRRLSHAKDHADIEITTDELTPEEVFSIVKKKILKP
jgi:deoxyadenosine/deoxycytidine kinase